LFWGLDCGAIFDCGGNGVRFADGGDSLPPTCEFLEREPENDCLVFNPPYFHVFTGGVKLVCPIFVVECLILDGIDPSWPVGFKIVVDFTEVGPDGEPFFSLLSEG